MTFHAPPTAPPTSTTTTTTPPSPPPVGSAQVWWVSLADLVSHLPSHTLPPTPDFVLVSEDGVYTDELLPTFSMHPERSLCLAGPLTTSLGPPSVLVLTHERGSPHLNAHVFLHNTFIPFSQRKAETVWTEWIDEDDEPAANQPAAKRQKRLPVPPPPASNTVEPDSEAGPSEAVVDGLEPESKSEPTEQTQPQPSPSVPQPPPPRPRPPPPSPAPQPSSASTSRDVPRTGIHPSSLLPERIQYAALVVFQTTSPSSSKSLKVDAVFDQVLGAIRMVPGSGGVRVTPTGLRGLFERLWNDGVAQSASRGLSLPGLVVSQLRWALLTDTWPSTDDDLEYLARELKEMAIPLGFTRRLSTDTLVNWREKYESDLEGWRNECSQILGFIPRSRSQDRSQSPPRPVPQQTSVAGSERERQRIPPPQTTGTPPPSSAHNRLAGRLGGRRPAAVTETPPPQHRQGQTTSSSTSTTSTSSTYKTRLCKYYLRTRRCPHGDQCTYAHGQQELRMPPPRASGSRLASRLGQ